jgi:hypothetical protein
MQYVLKHQRGLLFSLLLVAYTAVFTSCGKDEPSSTVIDYYLDIEEEFLINGSTNLTDRYYSPITRMRDAIRKTYPTPDNKGNDEAVVAACDKEYEEYYQMYIGEGHHFTSLFHLVRVIKTNGIVKQSETLRTFVYDINPVETDVEE